MKAVWAARFGTTQKKVWTATFLCLNSTSQTTLESSPSLTLQYAVSAGLAKRKKLQLFFGLKTKKYRLSELYDAPLEGSTMSLYRSSTSLTPWDSSGLAELKHPFFSRTGRNTKKLRRSNLFQLTIFKHGIDPRGIDNFTSIQLHKPYKVWKLSIRRVKMRNFSRIRRNTKE